MAVDRTIKHRDGTVERVTTSEGGAVRERSGGGAGTIVALVIGLLVVLVVGYFLMTMSRSEQLEANAVSSAAESVSGAAESVGDAAQNAAQSLPAPTN